jgi:hypothetical protein
LSKNIYNETNQYNSLNPNALSDGDEKGKGENNNSIGGLTDINNRISILGKNIYNKEIQYGPNHPNALSDGDDKGKADLGGLTDINARTETITRNKFNKTKVYPDFVI